jgi:hypothetical protein
VPVAMHVIGLYSTISDFENTIFSDGTRNMVESWPARSGSPEVAYENVKLAVADFSLARVTETPETSSNPTDAPTLISPSSWQAATPSPAQYPNSPVA